MDTTINARLGMALRALRYRNYRLFFAGQLVSLVGTWMQNVAQSWLVYRLTGSSFYLGMMGLASQIPIFLLAFVGGAVADRHDRHKLVIGTQAVSMVLALVLSMLTLMGTLRVWQLFVLAAVLGVVNAFDMPARQAFIAELVGKEDLLSAIALNSSIFNGARVIGPAVAGLVVAWVGEGWCFFINGLSYMAVVTGLAFMRLDKRNSGKRKGSAMRDVLEGLLFVLRTPSIRALLLLLGLLSVVGMPYSVLMPIFADRVLRCGPSGLGFLMGSVGFGALMGSLLLASRTGVRGLGKLVAGASAGFGAGLALFSISRSFWLSVIFLFPVGMCFMMAMACSNTLIQTIVPDQLRGRVMATHVWMILGMMPFGSFIAGTIAEHAGAPLTLLMGALLCLVGAGGFALRIRKLQIAA